MISMGNNSRKKRRRRLEEQEKTRNPSEPIPIATEHSWSISDRLAIALSCLAAALAIVIFWIDRTPTTAATSLVLIAGLMIYPILHFIRKRTGRIIAYVVLSVMVTGFGWKIWSIEATLKGTAKSSGPSQEPQAGSPAEPSAETSKPANQNKNNPAPRPFDRSEIVAEVGRLTDLYNSNHPGAPPGQLNGPGRKWVNEQLKRERIPAYITAHSDPQDCRKGHVTINGFTAIGATEAVETNGEVPCLTINNLVVAGGKGVVENQNPKNLTPSPPKDATKQH